MVVLMGESYASFLERKSQAALFYGFDPVFMPDFLFDFQKYLLEWSILKGRSAIFADCGLGKTPMQLAWADNIVRKTNKPVLILTPLGVSQQTIREGEKFGIELKRSREGKIESKIVVTNYERLHYFNNDDFAGVVCDESSAIKAFDGKRRKEVTRFLSKIKYRLLCTATPSPNDFIELGTSSEALGELTQSEMLSTFFRSSDNMRHSLFKEGDFWNRAKWFFRAHAETPFWRWVCSWARALQKPEDMGFDGSAFILPPLNVKQHVVDKEMIFPGELFPRVAMTLKEQRVERRFTMEERCQKVAELVNHDKPCVVWCQYNDEGDFLEKMIPGSVQIAGQDSDDDKEDRLLNFSLGNIRVLVTKPKIGAWGLNWQHCGHHTFFPSHSFEQYYQAIRRSWRFGRVGPVRVDVVTTHGEKGVTENLRIKQEKTALLFKSLVDEMNNPEGITTKDLHLNKMEVPAWLS
jgi:hypothetical protein